MRPENMHFQKMRRGKKRCLTGLTALAGLLASCGGSELRQLYRLQEIRVPVAQFLVRTSSDPVPDTCSSVATKLAERGKYQQQFPGRPGQEIFLRFVLLSPPGAAPQLQLLETESYLQPFWKQTTAVGTSADVPVKPLPTVWQKVDCLSVVRQETPMHIEEVTYKTTLPSEADVEQAVRRGGAPGLKMRYRATGVGESDSGFVDMLILPDPSGASWSAVDQLAQQAGATTAQRESLKNTATTNFAPILGNITPATTDVLAKNSDNTLDVDVTTGQNDTKSRFFWFVTGGDILNPRAKQMKWKPKDSSVGAFVMIRDLQGGTDYAFSHWEAN